MSMDDETAAWVRAWAWSAPVRRENSDPPELVHTCACQYGPSGHCARGAHQQCHATTPLPSPETYILARDGRPLDRAGRGPTRVWLSGRGCRWVCPCRCHQAPEPAQPAQGALF